MRLTWRILRYFSVIQLLLSISDPSAFLTRLSTTLLTFVLCLQIICTLSDHCIQIHPYAQMALTVLTSASKVFVYPVGGVRLTRLGTDHLISGKPRRIHCGSGCPNRQNIRAHPGTQVSIEDQLQEGSAGTNCPSSTRMCTVHIKLLQGQELLYVATCTADSL